MPIVLLVLPSTLGHMTETASTWLVQVLGEPYYVDDLPHYFPSGPSFAAKREGCVYLHSERFSNHQVAKDVHDEAERLLDEMCGALSVFLGTSTGLGSGRYIGSTLTGAEPDITF